MLNCSCSRNSLNGFYGRSSRRGRDEMHRNNCCETINKSININDLSSAKIKRPIYIIFDVILKTINVRIARQFAG